MRVQNLQLPERKDLGDAPGWVDRLLGPLGGHLELVTTALQTNLSVLANFNWDVRTLLVPHNTEVEIRHEAREPILGVHLIGSGLFDYATLAWERVEAGRIKLKVKWDSAPTADTSVTLLVVGAG